MGVTYFSPHPRPVNERLGLSAILTGLRVKGRSVWYVLATMCYFWFILLTQTLPMPLPPPPLNR